MAYRPSNQDRIRWTISLLNIKPDDRLLEIGFGPGFAIELVSKITSEGFVAGIDHSEVMVRQASKRNARAIREGAMNKFGTGDSTMTSAMLQPPSAMAS